MGFFELVAEAVKALVPPKTNDLDVQQRWRWAVFVSIVAVTAAFCGHIALECGWIPMVYAGVAQKSEIRGLAGKVDQILTIGLERDIRDKVLELCRATDPQLRQELRDDIDRLQKDYRALNGDWPRLPKCGDL